MYQQAWDKFVTSQKNHTFLHSWAWGAFNESMGDRVWWLGVYDTPNTAQVHITDRIMGVALVIKVHAKRGNFLFVPHGPILADSEKTTSSPTPAKALAGRQDAVTRILIERIKKIAKQEKVNFIRISPILSDTDYNKNIFSDLGFRHAPIHMHAETTWSLDLAPSEDELLMGMRKTTRNLIRRAMKEGVEIKTGTSDEDIKIFYDLYKETVKKHNFTPFSLTFIQNQVKIFADDDAVQVFTAWHNGQPLAASIVVFYGDSAFYHHGASVQSRIPAAYLTQWEAIREAKRRGHKLYNFWGIIREDAPTRHPWQGITLFKKGFGGFQTDYLHAQDMPRTWQYWINWTIETIRKKIRHL